MMTTLDIDNELLERAVSLTGIEDETTLVQAALQALIVQESARRLAALGGSQPDIEPIRRRRGHD